ncbi:hypothetical protein PSAC2689_50435 [Paraburkholderia sacchari]
MGTDKRTQTDGGQMTLVTPKGARVDSVRYPDIADLMSRLRFAPGDGRIWLPGNQRWRVHHALEAFPEELPVKSISARARLVDDADASRFGLQSLAQTLHVGLRGADLARVPCRPPCRKSPGAACPHRAALTAMLTRV